MKCRIYIIKMLCFEMMSIDIIEFIGYLGIYFVRAKPFKCNL